MRSMSLATQFWHTPVGTSERPRPLDAVVRLTLSLLAVSGSDKWFYFSALTLHFSRRIAQSSGCRNFFFRSQRGRTLKVVLVNSARAPQTSQQLLRHGHFSIHYSLFILPVDDWTWVTDWFVKQQPSSSSSSTVTSSILVPSLKHDTGQIIQS